MTSAITDYTPDTELPSGFIELYKEAFPPEERRQWADGQDLRQFMAFHPKMKVKIKKTAANPHVEGFVIYWQLTPTVRYVEHLATASELRGQGLGAALMRTLLNEADQHLILEVEPPTDTLTMRRIGFYNRLGLVLHDKLHYKQPPYAPTLPEVRLCIMSTSGLSDQQLTDETLPLLKSIVYQH